MRSFEDEMRQFQALEAQNRRDPPEHRYQRDPDFHALVNLIEGFIERAQFTPTEVREAAMLAAIRYETRHVRDRYQDVMLRGEKPSSS